MKLRLLAPALLVAAACGGSAKPESTVPAPPSHADPIATPTPVAAATPPPVVSGPPKKIRTVEGITEYHLDNGLTILLFPDTSQSTVTVNLTYLVGSRLEGYGETGMAHLLEHMMFKGTKRLRDISKLLDEKGGQNNAETGYDRTNYYETLPASQANLDWALDMEADRMVNSTILADDLKSEFSVVRNEFESGENNPGNILYERVSQTAYLWHNYGKPVIGARADIEHVPASALHVFYEKYYQPDNAVLVLSGKFDEAAALATITRTLGAIAKPTRVLPSAYTVEPVQDGERRVTLSRTGDIHIVELAYHVVSGGSPDYAAVEAAADLLTRQPSGRLYKKLVETKLASSIGGGASPTHDPFLATFNAEIRDAKNVDKVEKTMIDEIDRLGDGAIDPKELERWRTSSLKELELAMTNSQELALYLSEFIAIGDWRALFAYRDAIAKVTPADVARVAKLYFKPSNRTVGRFEPTASPARAPLTEAANIADYVKGVHEGGGMDAGEVFAGTFDNIDARTKRGELKGGIKTALLAKKTRGGKVQLELHLHWGDEKSLQGKSTAAEMMGSLMARGTTKKSYQDLQDLQDQLKAHIWISSDATGMTLHVDTLRDKLAPALDLASEMLTQPSFPGKELELIRQQWLAAIEQQLQDPQALASVAYAQASSPWPKSDPRYTESIPESLAEVKKVSLADITGFYKKFAGAGHGELVVIGDFDAAAVSAQIEKLTSSWTSKAPYARLANKPFGVAAVKRSIDVKDKENTVLVMGHDLSMRDSDPDYAAFQLANQILGGDEGARLWMRLREHEGLSYGVGSQVWAGALDDAAGFRASAIVAPANLAKARASMLEEITRLTSGAIEPAELARAKDAWIKNQDTSLSDDGYVAELLEGQLYNGRTMDFSRQLRAKLQAVTVADASRVAKARLQPDRLIIIDAGDVSKAK